MARRWRRRSRVFDENGGRLRKADLNQINRGLNAVNKGVNTSNQSLFFLDKRSIDALTSAKDQNEALGTYIGLLRSAKGFVNIVTGKSVPVKFSTGDSYTDGSSITIGADLANFDANIGVALHEAHHIAHTDFVLSAIAKSIWEGAISAWTSPLNSEVYSSNIINRLKGRTSYHITRQHSEVLSHKGEFLFAKGYYSGWMLENASDRFSDSVQTKLYPADTIWSLIDAVVLACLDKSYESVYTAGRNVHFVHNVIEDMRIDRLAQKDFPGYGGYYDALYNGVTKKLKDADKTNPLRNSVQWDSYKKQLILLIAGALDVKALPGLQEIVDIIDVPGLTNCSSQDTLLKSVQVISVIMREIEKAQKVKAKNDTTGASPSESKKPNNNKGMGDNSESKNSEAPNVPSEKNSEHTSEASNDANASNDAKTEDSASESTDAQQFNTREQDDLDSKESAAYAKASRHFDEVEEAINGSASAGKGKLTPRLAKKIEALSDSGAQVSEIKNPVSDRSWNRIKWSSLKDWFTYMSTTGSTRKNDSQDTDKVLLRKAINKARASKGRLEFRNIVRYIDYIRKEDGKLDRRLVHELAAFGNKNVFKQTQIETYSDAWINISIDMSASMDDEVTVDDIETTRYMAAMAMAFQIVALFEDLNGVRITIEGRLGGFNWGSELGMVTIFDTINGKKIDSIIEEVSVTLPEGSTPEDVLFPETIARIERERGESKAFFISLTDGAPVCMGLNNHIAHAHKCLAEMAKKDITFSSYYLYSASSRKYVGEESFLKATEQHTQMYGKLGHILDEANLAQLVATLRKTICK